MMKLNLLRYSILMSMLFLVFGCAQNSSLPAKKAKTSQHSSEAAHAPMQKTIPAMATMTPANKPKPEPRH